MINWLLLAGTVVCASALLVAEHYLPWSRLIGHMLGRPTAYVLGLGTVGLTWTAWACVAGLVLVPLAWWEMLVGFWVISCFSGAAVTACHRVDDWLGRQAMRAARRAGDDAGR